MSLVTNMLNLVPKLRTIEQLHVKNLTARKDATGVSDETEGAGTGKDDLSATMKT